MEAALRRIFLTRAAPLVLGGSRSGGKERVRSTAAGPERRQAVPVKAQALLAVAAALWCLGASKPPGGGLEPYFPEDYEAGRTRDGSYRQRYHEGILVTGTPGFIARVGEALDLIEATDRRNWYFVRKHIRRITLTGHPGMDVGGGRFTSGDGEGETTAWFAGKIVHDAWHRELYFRGLPWEGREAELFCLERQKEFLGRLDDDSLDVEEALRSEYWKVDYRARDW